MFFALYDSWRRAQILRKNVSSDALKLFHSAAEKGGAAPEKGVGPTTSAATAANSGSTPFTSPTPANPPSTSSPFSWGNPKGTGSLLDRLLQVRHFYHLGSNKFMSFHCSGAGSNFVFD
jgi:hypothetical protein